LLLFWDTKIQSCGENQFVGFSPEQNHSVVAVTQELFHIKAPMICHNLAIVHALILLLELLEHILQIMGIKVG
jgi:hypothetical protein